MMHHGTNWHVRDQISADGIRIFSAMFAIGAAMVFFHPTYFEIFGLWWNNSSYNHCLLIIPISMYLAWQKRSLLATCQMSRANLGILFIFLNVGIWLTGNVMSVSLLQHIAAVGMIIGALWAFLGDEIFSVLFFPILYLYFCVPEGEILIPYLQDVTAEVVVTLLRATGIPVFLEGRYLTIPSGNFHVAKACSGINYLVATLAVGTVFAYVRFQSFPRRVLFMLLAIVVPVMANGIRAYGIVIIAHYSNYKYAMGVDHFIYGWLFFGVVIFGLFALGNLFSDVTDEAGMPDTRSVISPSVSVAGNSIASYALLLFCVTFLFGATGAAANKLVNLSVAHYDIGVPSASTDWVSTTRLQGDLGTNFIGAHQHVIARYSRGGATTDFVDLEIYYYRRQEQGKEIVNFRNSFYDADTWRRLSGPDEFRTRVTNVPLVEEMVISSGTTRNRLIWYWYDVSGKPTLSSTSAKWLSVRAGFAGDYIGEAAVILSTDFDREIDVARARLTQFMSDHNVHIENLVQ